MSVYKFLIVSDLHVGTPEDYNNSTRLSVDTAERPIHENPIESLKDFIRNRALLFNAVINLGDVSNKGYVPGWILGCKMLRELSTLCNCPLIHTPGNHDYCFSYKGGPQTLLLNTSNYPTDNQETNDNFWGIGYCLYDVGGVQFLLFNSESHLKSIEDLKEIPDYDKLCKRDLDEYLKAHPFNGPRVAILHHHVIPHSDPTGCYTANDIIDHSDKMLTILKNNNFSCLLHGHKHLARFTQYDNLGIMACGSVSSRENISTCDEDNHFHILTLDCKEDGVRGKIESFHFVFQKGWFEIEDSNSRVKASYGFGKVFDIKAIADTLEGLINPDAPVLKLFDKRVIDTMPDISYLSIDEIKELKGELEARGYNVLESKNELVIFL